jgi:hypothetical protein
MKLHYTLRCWRQLLRTNIFHCLDYLSELYASMCWGEQDGWLRKAWCRYNVERLGSSPDPAVKAGSSELGFRLFNSSHPTFRQCASRRL